MATAAAAVVAATTVIEVFCGWQATEFKRLGHVLHDIVLDLAHFALSIQEVLGHGVVQERIAVLVEVSDLVFREFHAHLLLLLEHLAFQAQSVVLTAGSVVFQERGDLTAEALKFSILEDGFAKLGRFRGDCFARFGGCHAHNNRYGSADASEPRHVLQCPSEPHVVV